MSLQYAETNKDKRCNKVRPSGINLIRLGTEILFNQQGTEWTFTYWAGVSEIETCYWAVAYMHALLLACGFEAGTFCSRHCREKCRTVVKATRWGNGPRPTFSFTLSALLVAAEPIQQQTISFPFPCSPQLSEKQKPFLTLSWSRWNYIMSSTSPLLYRHHCSCFRYGTGSHKDAPWIVNELYWCTELAVLSGTIPYTKELMPEYITTTLHQNKIPYSS